MILFILLLSTHWVMDFIMQAQEDALNKSHSNKHLFNHVNEYSLGIFLMVFFYLLTVTEGVSLGLVKYSLGFWGITFICHFVTDYYTSKESARRYKLKRMYGIKGFWAVIGFDQLLHTLQLLLTIYFLNNLI